MRQPATVLASLVVSAAIIGGSVGSVAAASQAVPEGAPARQVTLFQDEGTDGTSIWVPTYAQERNLSCEYAAAVIAMGAYGVWVNEFDLDSMVGWSENPHWGYRGDITGWWGNTDDYGVYASALAPAIRNYGFWADEFYAQGDASALTSRLDAGSPVIVWLGLWGDTSFYQWTSDGTPYKLASGMHVVVAYGYDSGGVMVSDPAHGTKHYYDWGTFMTYWNVLDGMGLAVGPL
ncbi:MAG: C39 family peptidase [Thermomicrobiales bacterium]